MLSSKNSPSFREGWIVLTGSMDVMCLVLFVLISLLHGRCKRPAMVEEFPVPGTQVVQSGFPVRRMDEPVFRTFPVAHVPHLTIKTVPGQGTQLRLAEGFLLIAIQKILQGKIPDIAQAVLRNNEMIA